jgi:class 3 adenylate cyclase
MLRESHELAAVMKRLMIAIQSGDSSVARGLVAKRPETLLIGIREENWLHGEEAYVVLAAQLSRAEEYQRLFHRVEAYESGSAGWAAAESTVTFPDGVVARVRTTAVFHLEDGVWRVVQWHASHPSELDTNWGKELPQRLSDLVGLLDADLEEALTGQLGVATLTFLISDIEASTDLNVEFGDEAWSSEVNRHFAELHRIADAQNGTVVKTMGDGALLAFASASSGAHAALEIQRMVTERSSLGGYRVRLGLHSGDAVHTKSDYLGFTVNKTARIASAARGGQTLVSDAVGVLISDSREFLLGEPMPLAFRGLPGLHVVHGLTPK